MVNLDAPTHEDIFLKDIFKRPESDRAQVFLIFFGNIDDCRIERYSILKLIILSERDR
jgi:hypothetical protein